MRYKQTGHDDFAIPTQTSLSTAEDRGGPRKKRATRLRKI